MRVVYVETCDRCGCAVVRAADGAVRGSTRLKPACAGCSCHAELPLASGA